MRHASILVLACTLFATHLFAQDGDSPIIGEWTLYSYSDLKTGAAVYPPTELHRPIKLYFQPDSAFNANSFRVYISGKYSLTGNQIRISGDNTAKNLAENDLGEKFRTSFPMAEEFEVIDDTLILKCAELSETLHFFARQ